MDTFYLIDFENVHNEGIKNIDSLSKDDHVHIFSTQNALNIRQDVFWLNGDIKSHLVPAKKQSLDMHLVSYLGYLLGTHGGKCTYVIVSKDRDYDNIINFWKKEGYANISRKAQIPDKAKVQSKTVIQNTTAKTQTKTQTVNSRINAGMNYEFSGEDRSELNLFMQHGLVESGYSRNAANRICKYVVAHCNDERMLNGIHNDLKREYTDYSGVYDDVKLLLEQFAVSKSKGRKKEAQVRSFFEQNLKKEIFINYSKDYKEKVIKIVLNSQTRQQVNNELQNLYGIGDVVKHIYQALQPLIKDMPGK